MNSERGGRPARAQPRTGRRTTPNPEPATSNRYTLTAKIERLRAGLAKAERAPDLAAAGVHSADLYSHAEQRLDELIGELEQRIEAPQKRSPNPENG